MTWLHASLLFLGLLVGFVLGRRYGKEEGFSLGFAYAPLELRRQVLLSGRCLVCGERVECVKEPGN